MCVGEEVPSPSGNIDQSKIDSDKKGGVVRPNAEKSGSEVRNVPTQLPEMNPAGTLL
jgi:hypothetical protein